MTVTELRDTFASVSDAVPVPAPDQLAFQRRVTRARRRRTTARGLAVAAAVAAVGVGAAALPHGARDDAQVATPAPTAPGFVPVLLRGELAIVNPDGTATSLGLPVQKVLGRGDNGVVLLDPDGHLLVASVTESPGLGAVRDLSRELVRGAAVSLDGRALAWVDQSLTLHQRGDLDGSWSWSYDAATQGGFNGTLVATDGAGWIAKDGGSVSLVSPQVAGAPVVLDAGENARGAQLAGDTVAVQTRGGVSFFDLGTGDRRLLDLGGAVGGLSTDGRWYATSVADWQRDDGASPDLNLIDTRSGETHVVDGYDDSQQALSVWWADADRFVVLTDDGDHRVLWDCSVVSDHCVDEYYDSTRTMELPGQE